jgi:hypothetical protein
MQHTEFWWKVSLKTRGQAVDGIGSELCPTVGFHISSFGSSGFTTRVSVIICQSFSEEKYVKTGHPNLFIYLFMYCFIDSSNSPHGCEYKTCQCDTIEYNVQ